MDNTISNDLDIDPKNEEQLLEESEALEQEEDESSVDDDEVAKLRSENKKLTEIIKRRKERDNNSSSTPEQKTTNNTQFLSRDEAILVASGFTGEDLDYLNVVAKGTGLSIQEAKEHPIFEAYLEKVSAEKKAKRAKLGASKGSSTHKPVDMTGLSAEDHRKIWEQKVLGK